MIAIGNARTTKQPLSKGGALDDLLIPTAVTASDDVVLAVRGIADDGDIVNERTCASSPVSCMSES
jgi:hypothetical protein